MLCHIGASRMKENQKNGGIREAVRKMGMGAVPEKSYAYPIKRPDIMAGVVPKGVVAPVLAMDGPYAAPYEYIGSTSGWVGFPGYPYLAQLSTRAEYRMFAQSMSTQLTREWIILNSTDTEDEGVKEKIAQITRDLDDLKLKDVISLMAEHDSYYGRGQLLINLVGQDLATPLLLSPKTIKGGPEDIKKYLTVSAVEAFWTTPNSYNAINPAAPDFYKPSSWFMIGQQVHSSRLLTVITRPVTDMLKPAFAFGGISMSQLAEPYVDNWLRTRQSVSDLISNFSITALQTDMSAILAGNDDTFGQGLIDRAEMFTLTKNNRNLMLLDKEREEIVQTNTPLSGLDALQAQAQEQLCSVSHTPSTVLLGVAPTGFGNVAEGEMRGHYDWIRALQYGFWLEPIRQVVDVIQMLRWGKIDQNIVIEWQPLYQMTPKELGEIRKADSDRDVALVGAGIVSAQEVRERLAVDPASGYQGLDVEDVPGAGDESLEEGDLP